MRDHREITLTRDCDAIQIPSGNPIILPKGMDVIITQSLGGTYTVATPGGQVPPAGPIRLLVRARGRALVRAESVHSP